jgi:hypothetical protein
MGDQSALVKKKKILLPTPTTMAVSFGAVTLSNASSLFVLLFHLGAADPTGCRRVHGVEATGSVSIKDAVIGFLSSQDKDLLDACLH